MRNCTDCYFGMGSEGPFVMHSLECDVRAGLGWGADLLATVESPERRADLRIQAEMGRSPERRLVAADFDGVLP